MNLPEIEKYFEIVVPTDNLDFNHPDYCGIFHFRIWRFGNWIDVVVDDLLPFYKGKLFYAKSEPSNELWPALLEKAYAKLNGNHYDAIWGGKGVNSLVDFTGGIGYTI